VQTATRVMRFDRDGHSTLLGVDNLAVVRGPADLMERAAHYANLGHDGPPLDVADVDMLEGVLTALDRLAPHGPPEEQAPAVTRLNIGNTYHCNMGCTYCYNELALKDRRGSEVPEGMGVETARAAIDALLAQAGEAKRLSLVFVGGEPLLEKHVLFQTVAYAQRRARTRAKSVDIAVYTNGTLMNERVIEWANETGVSLVVSLDGPPLVHDRRRVYLNGRPTSRIILKNIRLLMERSNQTVKRVRAVACERGLMVPLHRYFLALGFNEIHVQPVYDEGGISDTMSGPEMAECLAWYRDRLLEGTVLGVMPFEGILERLVHRRRAVTSWYPCTAGRSALGVGPDGRIYPCHHFLEEGRYQLGHVREGLPGIEARRSFFLRVDQREPCRSCWARHACGGECYHRAATAGVGYTGVLPDVCRNRKSLIGLVLEVFADLATVRPDVLRRLAAKDFSAVAPQEQAFAARGLGAYRS
jgi:uncharacterized protein